MHIHPFLSGFNHETEKPSRTRTSHQREFQSQMDHDFDGQMMDYDDAENLREESHPEYSLRISERIQAWSPNDPILSEGELHLPEDDFRDHLDGETGDADSCQHGRKICLTCSHPEIRDGEVCLGVMDAASFSRLRLKSKRKGTAFSDEGVPLSKEYCSVFAEREEVLELVVLFSVPLANLML